MKRLFVIFLFITTVGSCAQLDQETQNPAMTDRQESAEQGASPEMAKAEEQDTRLSPEKAFERLESLAKEAREAGPHAVNYLASDLFLKANTASMHGDYASAELILKFLIGLKPDDDYLKYKYAIALVAQEKVQEARPYLEQAYKNDHHNKEKIGFVLAGLYVAVQENVKAQKIYEELYSSNPESEDVCLFLARTYIDQKKYQSATSLLNKCEKKIPDSGIFSYFKAKLAIELNKMKRAEMHYKNSLKRDPYFYQSALGLASLYESQKKFKEAENTYIDHLSYNPQNSLIMSKLIQVYFIQEQYSKIIPYAEKLIKLDPSNLALKMKLGILYSEVKYYDQAIKIFKSLLSEVPESDRINFYIAAIYAEKKDYQKALDYYAQLKEAGPLKMEGILQQSKIMSQMALEDEKKSPQFFSFIEQSIKKYPSLKVDLNVAHATYFENTDQVQRALILVENIKEEAAFREAHKYYLATLYDKAKQHEKAEKLIWTMIKKNPENAHSWNFLGYSLLERNISLDKAFKYISKAIELSPNDGFIRDSLGWYYFKQGNVTKALEELKKARSQVDDDPVISRHLAEIYEAKKDYQMAKKYYEEALENSTLPKSRKLVKQALENLERNRYPASKK